MTSLARQLEKLAIPGQPSHKQLSSKKDLPSLLFQPDEVADISIDTIFSLALNGLEELVSIEPSFLEFEDSLFSESCKAFERTVQTKDVLDNVDEQVGRFLRLLSPYFLLKPAQKCLEWLIWVFRVNVYSVDVLMECVLPYYETRLFARVVQLLPLRALSRWHWLYPVKKTGSPLSKLTLTRHCLTDLSFLVFVCDSVVSSLRAGQHSINSSSRPVLSLYTSTVLDVLEMANPVTEELVVRLIPFVEEGLKWKSLEYRASTYMVVSQLASLVDLEDKLVVYLVERVSKSLCEGLLKEGLCCMAILCQRQKLRDLSQKSLSYLLRTSSLVTALSTLDHTHCIAPLLSSITSSLMREHLYQLNGGIADDEVSCERGVAVLNLLEQVLDEVQLEQRTACNLIRQLLDGIVGMCEEVQNEGRKKKKRALMERLRGATTSLAHSLDAKYPLMMDKALQQTIASIYTHHTPNLTPSSELTNGISDDNVEHKVKLLHQLLSTSLPQSSRHLVLAEVGSTLAVSIHHPNPAMRAAAITHLGEALQQSPSKGASSSCSASDDDFVSSSLLSRLGDDDPMVVGAVLDLGRKVLFKHLPVDELVSALTALLIKKKLHRSSQQWQEVALSSLHLLTSKALQEAAPHTVDDVIAEAIPLFYVGRNGNEFAGRVMEVMNSSFLARRHPAVEAMGGVATTEEWLSGCNQDNHRDQVKLSTANAVVFSHLGEGIALLQHNQLQEMLSKLVSLAYSTPTDQHRYFSLMPVIVSALKAVPLSESATQHQEISRLLLHIRQNRHVLEGGVVGEGVVGEADLAAVFLPLAEKGSDKELAHRRLFLWALQVICDHMIIPADLSSSMWLDLVQVPPREKLYYELLSSLFSLLTWLVNSRQQGRGQHVAKQQGKKGGRVTQPGRALLEKFLRRYFSECGALLRFLAMIWTATPGMELGNSSVLDPVLQTCGLSIGCAYIQSLDTQAACALVASPCPIVPSFLVTLASPHSMVREKALDCLQALQDACSPVYPLPDSNVPKVADTPPILALVHGITRHRLDISLDHAQINDVLGQLYQLAFPSTLVPTPPPTPRKRRSKRLVGGTNVETTPFSGSASCQTTPPCAPSWLESVLTHVIHLRMPGCVQVQVLRLLNKVDSIGKLVSLVPLLSAIMDDLAEKQEQLMDSEDPLPSVAAECQDVVKEELSVTLEILLLCFTPNIASSLSDHPLLFKMLLRLLKTDTPSSSSSSPQMLALTQLSPVFFEKLGSPKLQLALVRRLVDVLVETKSSDVTATIKQMVAKYPLTVDLVAAEVTKHLEDVGGDVVMPTPKKRRRVKLPPPSESRCGSDGGVVCERWKRVTVVLELVEHNCHLLPGAHQLVAVLFSLLLRVLELEEKVRLELEYVQQLVLSCLLAITAHHATQPSPTKELLLEGQFNVELVVQCIRLSSSPQTHHHALLLLTSAANIFPCLVLHNIMPIFTFMGAQLLRQDDLYSFQVITKTIDTVIPALIKSGSLLTTKVSALSGHAKKQLAGVGVATSKAATNHTTIEGIVTEVIRIFVDALPHIPDHRKLPLFSHLLSTLGSRDYLHVALGLMTEKQVVQGSAGGDKEQLVEETLLEPGVMVGVAQEFPPSDQITASYKLAEYLLHLPETKPTMFKLRQLPSSVSALFNVPAYTDQQLQLFKMSSLSLLTTLLSHPHFIAQVAMLEEGQLEEEILMVLRMMLKYASHLSRIEATHGTSIDHEGTRHKCLDHSYFLLDKVTSLLSPASFLEVMVQLVCTPKGENEGVAGSLDVQKRALEILAGKLEDRKFHFLEMHAEALLNLSDVLMSVAVSRSTPSLMRQTSLKCVRLVVARLSLDHNKQLLQLAKAVMKLLSVSEKDEEEVPLCVRSGCLLCVSELCLVLGPHLIPLLHSLFPLVLRHLDHKLHRKRYLRLQLSAAAALHAVVETLPNFLSSFVADIILKLCPFGGTGTEDHKRAKLEAEVSSVMRVMSKSVPVRNLLPAYLNCCDQIMPQGKESVLALLGMLQATVNRLSKEDNRLHGDVLCRTLLACLDYRTRHTQRMCSLPSVLLVEKRTVEVFTDLVVRLSETQFHQIFLKLLDWASNPSSPKLRLITFYHLADRTADKLKSLFLLFAGHFFANAVHLLDISHSQKDGFRLFLEPSGEGEEEMEEEGGEELAEEHSCLLLDNILQCLTKCFLYDRAEFLSMERFEALLQPLVHQVSNVVGGKERSGARLEATVGSCVAHFGLAAGKEGLWKKLNHQLLLKTRHKNSQVRAGTLKVLQEFYSKLGEEFAVLLPESIPFLSELLEDECEEVEALAQRVVATIEHILGESIQQYF